MVFVISIVTTRKYQQGIHRSEKVIKGNYVFINKKSQRNTKIKTERKKRDNDAIRHTENS